MTNEEIHSRNIPAHEAREIREILLDGGSVTYHRTDTGYIVATLLASGRPEEWAIECAAARMGGMNTVQPGSDIVDRAMDSLPIDRSLPAGKRAHLMRANGECIGQI